ncbi:ATP-grasp domain-containing protein [Iamia sp. SCSIO 61187]|uniref:ATP-grasp domain-containing protein n=1 Tax=Iamia sp. SCSIO 61187 TaxID=2722752 RepID=UPI001C62E365|nr:ATP-grasp domain-containing protein [Iamia sp. SCSIO 61187]QYG93286.1 ATP-grasp domain-containing protein [Iamia sp. SCSIO 61187]
MGAGEVARAIDRLVGGRDVVLTTNAVRGVGPLVEAVRSHGAARVLVLGTGEGTGDRPDDVTTVLAPRRAGTMSEEVVALEGLLEGLEPEALAAIDAWDPDRQALVLANPFVVGADLGGRPIVGQRRPAWAAVEDKATVDDLLVAAGVPVPAHEVVAPAQAGAAARRVDRGDGVVVAAGGRNGGAEMVRWVDPTEAAAVAEDLVARATWARGAGVGRVRVAPFVEGVPCSIGAFVTGDGVAVRRPVENLNLRRGRGFLYAGISTTYDPPPAVRGAMEDAARRVGEELRRRVGYRGAFAIDGIAGADGWVATEVNARLSGGFGALPVDGDLPHVGLVQVLVAEGLADDVLTAPALEALYGARADASRTFRLARVVDAVPPGGPTGVDVVVDGPTARVADPDEDPHGHMLIGAAATGAVVLVRMTSDTAPLAVGPSAAPLAVSLLDLAGHLWATGTAGLTPPGGPW